MSQLPNHTSNTTYGFRTPGYAKPKQPIGNKDNKYWEFFLLISKKDMLYRSILDIDPIEMDIAMSKYIDDENDEDVAINDKHPYPENKYSFPENVAYSDIRECENLPDHVYIVFLRLSTKVNPTENILEQELDNIAAWLEGYEDSCKEKKVDI